MARCYCCDVSDSSSLKGLHFRKDKKTGRTYCSTCNQIVRDTLLDYFVDDLEKIDNDSEEESSSFKRSR